MARLETPFIYEYIAPLFFFVAHESRLDYCHGALNLNPNNLIKKSLRRVRTFILDERASGTPNIPMDWGMERTSYNHPFSLKTPGLEYKAAFAASLFSHQHHPIYTLQHLSVDYL